VLWQLGGAEAGSSGPGQQRRLRVLASDHNPHAHELLRENARANCGDGCTGSWLRCCALPLEQLVRRATSSVGDDDGWGASQWRVLILDAPVRDLISMFL
jgi:hypothetical protein